MTDFYADAVAAIPGVIELERTAEQLREAHAALTVPESAFAVTQALARDVVAAVGAGEPLPEDFGRRAFDASRAVDVYAAENSLLEFAVQIADDERNAALRTGTDHGLRHLAGRLHELLDEARATLTGLGGVRSADAAIEAGPEESASWASIGRLASDYAGIRAAQRQLTVIAAGGTGRQASDSWLRIPARDGIPSPRSVTVDDVLARVGEIANLAEVEPDWAVRARERGPARMALLFDDPRGRLLELLSTPGARIWLPTVDEACAAYADARVAAHLRAAELRERRDARVEVRPSVRREGDIDRQLAAHRIAELGTDD